MATETDSLTGPAKPKQLPKAKLEVGILLLAFWLPTLCSALDSYLTGRPFQPPNPTVYFWIYAVSVRLGQIAIMVYFMSQSSQPLAAFGFDRFKLKHGAIGLGVLAALTFLGWSYSYVEAYFHLDAYLARGTFNNLAPAFWVTVIPSILFEEVMYRSYLLTRLKGLGWKPAWTVVFSAVLFASYHIYQGPAVLPNIFLMGIVFGLVFQKSKSIWPGFLGHLLYDSYLFAYMFVWQAATRH